MSFHSAIGSPHPARLATSRRVSILDTLTDDAFNRLTWVASRSLGVPAALVFLVDGDREFYKSAAGLTEPLATSPEGSLTAAFCRQVATSGEPLVIEYAAVHAQKQDDPTGGRGVAAFIGIPLITSDEQILGTFCVLDSRPRRWTADEVENLRELAGMAVREVESYRDRAGLELDWEREAPHTEYFGALIENALDVITILNADGTIRYGNPAVERVLGYPPEELAGRSIFEFLHPDDAPVAVRVFIRGIGRPGSSPALQFRVRHAGGEWRTHEARGTNLLHDPGVAGVLLNTRDITDRKLAEATLAAAEAHYRRLVETSPYGIYALDTEGRFTEINPAGAEITGRATTELLGHPFADVIAPEDLEISTEIFHQVISGETRQLESNVRVLRPSGERRLVRVIETAIFEEGSIVGVHGIARDVTDERAREMQLRRAERLASVGTLVSGVAHELNNPLTSIKSFAQLMLLDDRPAEDRESLEIIQREAERTVNIVADLRLLARQAHDDPDSQRTSVLLNDLIRDILRARGPETGARSVELRMDLAPDLPAIWADREQIAQVVLNLVINAEQAMRDHPGERLLQVRTRRIDRGVSLAVEDSGPGIRPEDLERIFDPFWTTKDPGEGTGLGLSLVHNIVADHGGEIRVESAPGEGAVFTVHLPQIHRGRAGPAFSLPSG